MAGNKKISQLVDGGAGQAGDNYVIERGGVNFKVDQSSVSGNPGGLLLNGIVNDFIVKDEKSLVALEQRITLPPALSFVNNTLVPPTEVNGDIYLLDDTGATNAAWDGAAANSWVRFDGTATLWKEITAGDGFICTLLDTGFVRHFDPTSSTWDLFGITTPAGANTEIQFNAAGVFGASSLFTFDTGFGVFSCDAAAVFNDGGTDQDFRIEGLSEANLFFLDAGTDTIGIGDVGIGGIRLLLKGASNGAGTNSFVVRNSDNINNFVILDNGQTSIKILPQAGFNLTVDGTSSNGIGVYVGSSQRATLFTEGTGEGLIGLNDASAVNKIRISAKAGSDNFFDNLANFGLGTQAFDATATNTFAVFNGTPPAGGLANALQIYSADHNGAATATLHSINEEGNTFIYKSSAAYTRNAVIVEDRTLLASASATTLNNNNVLAALVADLQSQGLIG